MRHGTGICRFANGALYRGEWRNDFPNGLGILYSGKNEIIECKFENGYISNGRIKFLMQDGSYYEGNYIGH